MTKRAVDTEALLALADDLERRLETAGADTNWRGWIDDIASDIRDLAYTHDAADGEQR